LHITKSLNLSFGRNSNLRFSSSSATCNPNILTVKSFFVLYYVFKKSLILSLLNVSTTITGLKSYFKKS
jgi:hypothetical protein